MESSSTTGRGGEVHAHIETNPTKGAGMSGKYSGATETDVVLTPAGGQDQSRTDQAREKAGEVADQARERMDEAKGRAGEMASQAKEKAGQAFDRAESALQDSGAMSFLRDNPLAALGLAFGAGFILAGSSDVGSGKSGTIGKAKHQLKGAVMGGLSAAVAQEVRSMAGMQGGSGGLGSMLNELMGNSGGGGQSPSSGGSSGRTGTGGSAAL